MSSWSPAWPRSLGSSSAWLLTVVVTAPILDLARRARRVAGGDLSVRSPVWAADEMGYLAQSFNTMVDALEASQAALVKSNADVSDSNEEPRRLCEDLSRKEEARIGLLARVVTAQEDERQRLSRELHDGAGQMLASLLVHLKLVEKSRSCPRCAPGLLNCGSWWLRPWRRWAASPVRSRRNLPHRSVDAHQCGQAFQGERGARGASPG